MSEESLLSSDIQEEQPNQSDVSQPSLERPEWLQDKYLSNDRTVEDAIKEQARAYAEAQKRLGGFVGAPEAYEFKLPEGVEGEIDTEMDAYKSFVDIAKKANMNNETAQELFNIFVDYQNSQMRQTEVDFNNEMQQLGPDAGKRIQYISGWANSNLSPEQNEALLSMTTTAKQIEVIEALIGKSKNSVLPKTNTTESVKSTYTLEDYARDAATDRYKTDKHFRDEVLKKISGMQ